MKVPKLFNGSKNQYCTGLNFPPTDLSLWPTIQQVIRESGQLNLQFIFNCN